MYDLVVIGEGLSGLLTAIAARRQGYRTALITKGAGRIIQSSGLFDLIPGSDSDLDEWFRFHHLTSNQKIDVAAAIDRFKDLMNRLHLPYSGDIDHPVSVITGSGHLKKTVLYPVTVSPIPDQGCAVIIDFDELSDFQGHFAAANLRAARPQLNVHCLSLHLGCHSQRTLNQLDVARLLEQEQMRRTCIRQIRDQLTEQRINKPDLLIFPSVLGADQWQKVVGDFRQAFAARLTEASGLPPNASGYRLFTVLRREAMRLGVRFYLDAAVMGGEIAASRLLSVTYQTSFSTGKLSAAYFALATGGLLGGGLEATADGVRESVLYLACDRAGHVTELPVNLYPIGASQGLAHTACGIAGGVFTLLSSDQALRAMDSEREGRERHA